MLIEQRDIGVELYTQYWSPTDPLGSISVHPDLWRDYARATWGRYGYYNWREVDVEMHATPNRKFASRLASLTAALEYEGKTLFVIQTGFCFGGWGQEDDPTWSGVTSEHSAFTIRGADDYEAACRLYLPEENEYAGFGFIPTYDIALVVAPTSIIKQA